MNILKKIIFSLAIFTFFFGTNSAFAFEIKSGNAVYIAPESNISENFYSVGGSVWSLGSFDKDVFIVGGKIEIDGFVKGDLFILGGEVVVSGQIAGDVRIIGDSAKITGQVEGDLIILGGKIDLDTDSKILGQSIFAGAELRQNSALTQNSKVIAGRVTLNNLISDELEVITQKIILDKDANITGNLKYYAPEKADRNSNVKINGNVYFNEIKNLNEVGIVKSSILYLISFWIILRFITTLILAFVLVYIFKVFTQEITNIAVKKFVSSFFVGFLSLFVIPIVFLILFLSVIALPIGFMLLMIYLFIIILSPAIAGIVVGLFMHNLFSKESHNDFITFKMATIGVILMTFIQFVPIIGNITIAIFTLVALGAIYKYIYNLIIK